MDERQAQIKEGAGLEDSRINTEFLDFLSKWSTPFFVLLLVFAAGMFGYRKLKEMRVAAIDQAFLDYDLATAGGNPAPSTLALLGEDYMDTRSVGLMAKLDEADIYFNAARTGLAPGSQPDAITGEISPDDKLTPEQISSYLASAGSAYTAVLQHAEKGKKPMIAVSAAFGSAAVLGSTGDAAGAKAMYLKAQQIAAAAQLPLLEQVASERAAEIESLEPVTIYNEADLPALPSHDSSLDAITAPIPVPSTAPSTEETATDVAAPTEDAEPTPEADTPAADTASDGATDDSASGDAAPADDAAGDEPPLGS